MKTYEVTFRKKIQTIEKKKIYKIHIKENNL